MHSRRKDIEQQSAHARVPLHKPALHERKGSSHGTYEVKNYQVLVEELQSEVVHRKEILGENKNSTGGNKEVCYN